MSMETEGGAGHGWLDVATQAAAGVLLMPLLLALSPRTVVTGLRRRARLDLPPAGGPRTARLPLRPTLDAMRAALSRPAARRDWAACARLIRAWEDDRTIDGDGVAFTDAAVELLRWEIAEAVLPPAGREFDAAYRIDPAELSTLAAAAVADPSDHVLAALLAQLHVDRARFARREGRAAGGDSFAAARAALARFDAKALRSPVLAAAAFQLLAAEGAPLEDLRRAYALWAELDPANQYPHGCFAFHALPAADAGWAGFDAVAAAAARRTAPLTGAAAYATFYRTAMSFRPDAVDALDLGLFRRGLLDRIGQAEDRAAFAAALAIALHADTAPGHVMIWSEPFLLRRHRRLRALRTVCRDLVEAHLTHMPFGAGTAEESALRGLLCELFRKELLTGSRLRFGTGGLELHAVG